VALPALFVFVFLLEVHLKFGIVIISMIIFASGHVSCSFLLWCKYCTGFICDFSS